MTVECEDLKPDCCLEMISSLSHNGPELMTEHSRINLAEILSSPVALAFLQSI